MRLPETVFDAIVTAITDRMHEGKRVCLYSGADHALRSGIIGTFKRNTHTKA